MFGSKSNRFVGGPDVPGFGGEGQKYFEATCGRSHALHSTPHVAHKIVDAARSFTVNVEEIAACLECDPALAVRVLSAANRREPGAEILGLPEAVGVLGRDEIRRQVLSFVFCKDLLRGAQSKLFHAYRRHSLVMLSAAKRLAQLRPEVEVDQAAGSALVADIGMLFFAQHSPADYFRAVRDCSSAELLLQRERALFGLDHQHLGALAMERLGLPQRLQEAVANHHTLSEDASALQTVIAGANLVAELLAPERVRDFDRARQFLTNAFGINTDQLITLAMECRSDGLMQWDEIERELDEDLDCEELIACARQLVRFDPNVSPSGGQPSPTVKEPEDTMAGFLY